MNQTPPSPPQFSSAGSVVEPSPALLPPSPADSESAPLPTSAGITVHRVSVPDEVADVSAYRVADEPDVYDVADVSEVYVVADVPDVHNVTDVANIYEASIRINVHKATRTEDTAASAVMAGAGARMGEDEESATNARAVTSMSFEKVYMVAF